VDNIKESVIVWSFWNYFGKLFGFGVKILSKGVSTYSRLRNKSIATFINSWIFFPKGYVLIKGSTLIQFRNLKSNLTKSSELLFDENLLSMPILG